MIRRQDRYPGNTERGLSIVEVMIAAALLLIIALGILPLFSRSIISNRQGLDSTEVSNMARTQMEEYAQLPFNHLMLTVPDGDGAGRLIDGGSLLEVPPSTISVPSCEASALTGSASGESGASVGRTTSR